ncbi:MAG: hypothetical protein FJ202_09700 [Gemmatimonadetes bacterium]|nr:hypothetical protein [Gemmatimonadota bacterium]
MPRALTYHRFEVAEPERAAVLGAARERGRLLRSSGCNHWLFEAANARGEFLEFTEAASAERLAAAQSDAAMPGRPHSKSGSPLFLEVSLD